MTASVETTASTIKEIPSLGEIGVHFIRGVIDETVERDFSEFIVKSNLIFPPDFVLTVYVNSEGGSVYDGFAMIDMMKLSKLKIRMIGLGLISSIASLIFVSGFQGYRFLTPNSFMITHQFSHEIKGEFFEIIEEQSHLKDLHERFIQIYKNNSTMSRRQIQAILLNRSSHYFNATQALKYGLCDSIC